jgi:histidinol-phosphate aminotransferase
LLSAQGTFAGFTVAVSLSGAKKKLIPLTKDYRFDVDALADAIEPTTKILYIANANNPTGTYITGEEYERLMAKVPDSVLVIMDEAYFEYSRDLEQDYPDSLSYTYPNVLTLRTFSKVYGLASLRIGYGIASPEIIDAMMRVKLSFDPTGPGAAAGLGALQDEEFLRATVEMNSSELRRIYAKTLEWGLRVPYSAANFIMIECFSVENAQALYERLLRKGIITRPLTGCWQRWKNLSPICLNLL